MSGQSTAERADVADTIAAGGLVVVVGETVDDADAWLSARMPDAPLADRGRSRSQIWHARTAPHARVAIALSALAARDSGLVGIHDAPLLIVTLLTPDDALRAAVVAATSHETSRWYVSEIGA